MLPAAFAEDGPESGGAEEKTREEIQQVEDTIQNGGSTDADPGTHVTNVQNIVSGDVTGAVSQSGGDVTIERADDVTLKGGGKLDGANNLVVEKDGDYSASNIDSLKQGIIEITDGVNVRWSNGVLTADRAGTLDYKGSTGTDVVLLSADGMEFSVQKATAVQAGCFLAEDVEIARFSVGKTVTMTTSGDGRIVYGQGATLDYDGLRANSTVSASVTECRTPTYTINGMEVRSQQAQFTEIVNGTGVIETNPEYGVVCVNLTPVSTYDIAYGRVEDGFGVRAKEYAYKVCIQKAVQQKLIADCSQCGLVDLANQKITFNGMVDYLRYWYDSTLIEQDKQVAFSSTGAGATVIDLTTGAVQVQKDAPEANTIISNYLELYERDVDGATHRFLGVNAQVDRVAANWVKEYATSYAAAATQIENNHLAYLRSGCLVRVLPPNSQVIAHTLSELQRVEVTFT